MCAAESGSHDFRGRDMRHRDLHMWGLLRDADGVKQPGIKIHDCDVRILAELKAHPIGFDHHFVADHHAVHDLFRKINHDMLNTSMFTDDHAFSAFLIPGNDGGFVAHTCEHVQGIIGSMREAILFFLILQTHAGFHVVGHPSGGQVAHANIIGNAAHSGIDLWLPIMGNTIRGSLKDGAGYFTHD